MGIRDYTGPTTTLRDEFRDPCRPGRPDRRSRNEERERGRGSPLLSLRRKVDLLPLGLSLDRTGKARWEVEGGTPRQAGVDYP
uniref:Uncharacterized protein n=1 Tax=Phaffia rhodozyma TaxID=264483 RepID=Q9HFD9_PHARH|nr:hypothetical protein [Phaffia rhodozyma]